ncbi:Transcription initiation factor TFIID subunit 13 [Trichoplax sp. H2]|uniref:Transcription initiation factor TFIID subunit 13 n=1 Tax=Trichoplax adhaerens TaxID=10228 RepID=B3RY29_TRIAD|nr:hypothetical protein TRIADDRAFT_56419 [Trichoplax adhaerens]EDV24963.1 hypothetical protein TRIADDRAFT_56419 [Trichoplax adhaerens]RDD46803.1 Transcription initiation factor TFIID subunit 13 [Trichoplax sp. H2]|eukprot:XP_002112853.1 hypothetical protein TRIADDRAFT_56419 [Trichoplax adhaerens]
MDLTDDADDQGKKASKSDTHLESTESGSKRKRLFNKELRCMMYGFGDEATAYTESVDMLEEMVIEFISDTTLKALNVGKKGKIHVEDIIYVIRNDPKKYARVKDLLTLNEELKKARKAFDDRQMLSIDQ